MIFEMTRDYTIIVPLMISNLISFFISQQLQPEPIYEALALQEGVYLPTGESREALAGIPVSDVMQTGVELLSPGTDMDGAKLRFDKEKCQSWPTGENGYLLGVVSKHEIETAEPQLSVIRDLIKANGNYPYVHSDHPLTYALERMRSTGVDVVPVVSRANIHQMYGIVTLSDILATYGVSAATIN